MTNTPDSRSISMFVWLFCLLSTTRNIPASLTGKAFIPDFQNEQILAKQHAQRTLSLSFKQQANQV